MIIRKTQTATPLDRPFPDENTVSEMYCNEAYTIDNEAVEDWTSSLQLLLTFAAIFSAVLITLIVDSKTLLQQDKTEVLVDAVVFLMNNLANGTHRPYTPPSFHPSPQSIAVNCFFFASLCLSIATALAAVLAMQWVTDYGAVTRRAGSTPEERVKRRHFRYQSGQDWRMDTIIASLPIALHLSVLLFFMGLIVWMWDVHRSVFAVVIVCGAVAALFYILTTILAVFCPSCPYRTPLASGIYNVLHIGVTIFSLFGWSTEQVSSSPSGDEGAETISKLGRFINTRFTRPSLTSRDDIYIQDPDKGLMLQPLVWLSNQIPISPDVYRRLLVLVDGFSAVIQPTGGLPAAPWKEIFRTLGIAYQSFVQHVDLDEDEFAEFARRTQCLSQSVMSDILDSCLTDEDVEVDTSDFPIRLLHVWTAALSSHTTDTSRRQRFSDEVDIQSLISDISNGPNILLETWYRLLDNRSITHKDILPQALNELAKSPQGKTRKRLDATLYLISTRSLPWGPSVPFYNEFGAELPSTQLSRRLRMTDWVDSLIGHPLRGVILQHMSEFSRQNPRMSLVIRNQLTGEEEAELKRMSSGDFTRWSRPEAMLSFALSAFDTIARSAEGSTSRQAMINWIVNIICNDLESCVVPFDPNYFENARRTVNLRELSDPILRLIASATLGIEFDKKWLPKVLEAKDSLLADTWSQVSQVCFRNPRYFDGDYSSLWWLRLRLWVHFEADIPHSFLYDVMQNLAMLKQFEQDVHAARLGIDKAGDFLLASIHVNYAYGWKIKAPLFFTFIPDLLVGNIADFDIGGVSKDFIEYFSSVCDELNADPARLIRLLIELVRADINHDLIQRRPQILFTLLKHAKARLSDKDLRPFAPSCQRLLRYIKVSYGQFEDHWDNVVHKRYYYYDDTNPLENYLVVDREELKAVYEEVILLLELAEAPWEGEPKDVSWSMDLLRETGTWQRPFEEDVEEAVACLQNEATRDEGKNGNGESKIRDAAIDEPTVV